jgi:hypothetical protein
MPFSEFTIKWVEKYARGQVKPGTLADYDGYFRTHLLPAFGDHAVSRITIEDVYGFKTEKLNQGLSAQTVKHLLRLLRQMLQHAVEWGYLRENPAAKVKDPIVTKRRWITFGRLKSRNYWPPHPLGSMFFSMSRLRRACAWASCWR